MDAKTSHAEYVVRVDPATHELSITLRLTGEVARKRLRLEIPTWVPGDYEFSPLARDLFEVSARDTSSGDALRVTRDKWQAFHVDGGLGDVTVTYRAFAYAIEFAEPSGIVDHTYAILLGARYLHSPEHLGACTVRYVLPPDWQGTLHHPSGATQEAADTWAYPSYEILLDTPVVAGRYDRFTRRVCGTDFDFVFVDRGVAFETEAPRFVDDVAKIAEQFHTLFGSFPFSDYTFILTLNPAATWGLEHLSSTMCGLGPDVFTDPDAYATGVRVCAHELFHAWNVRRLRPSPLRHLDRRLTRGCFTEGLYVAEGFTRYYEFLSCTRSGVYEPETFFSNLVGYDQHLRATPAYARVTAVDASLATYLNHSDKYPGRPSNCIDYYDKGMLIAFAIDATLRLGRAGRSLDAAFRGFYERFVDRGPEDPGYTTRDVIGYFDEVEPGLGQLVRDAACRPAGLTTAQLLERLGFRVDEEEVPRLGLMFLDAGAPVLYNLLDDSPAGRCGLAPGDVVTTIDGFAYTPAALAWVARRAQPVTLGVTRGHRTLSFTLTPSPWRRISRLSWCGDETQAERLYAWFGRRFPLASGQAFALDFYENFHGVETVL